MLKKKKSFVTYTIIVTALLMAAGVSGLLFIQNSLMSDDMELMAYEKLSQEVRQAKKYVKYDENHNLYIAGGLYNREEDTDDSSENIWIFLQSNEGDILYGTAPEGYEANPGVSGSNTIQIEAGGKKYFAVVKNGKFVKSRTNKKAAYKICALVSHKDMMQNYRELRYKSYSVIAIVAIAFAIFALVLRKMIADPVKKLNNSIEESVNNLDFTENITYDGPFRELDMLVEANNNLYNRVQQELERQSEFNANVSHELRSPLSSIRGFLEAMEDGTIPTDEHEKYIEIVLDETRRMSGMVNDLLDIARIESGQYKLNLSVFDINDLIGRVLITFEARITAKHADVDAQLDYEPVFVEADRDRIGQVLHNLIDNAIKFMPENNGLLTIKSVVSKHKVYVSVCDNGPGIPKEDIAHIFDRFYKAEKAHTYKNGSGTGLGLSIVKLVIDQHHGEIKAESSENGTVFTFSLKQALPPPRRQPAAE